MIKETLTKIGLTDQESRVYIALLELQESQTGKLCNFTNIASSNIYKILDLLIKKGLISYRMQNNIKIFMPSPPEVLNELFLEKQKELDLERQNISKVISELKKRKIENEPQSNYKYYEGIVGIKSMWYEINTMLNKESVEMIYAGKKEAFEKLLGFYDEHHKIRNKLKAKAKILIPRECKDIGKKRKSTNTEIRLINMQSEAEWGIVDDTVYIQYIITKHPHGFLIKDTIFAAAFKEVFDKIWGQANNT